MCVRQFAVVRAFSQVAQRGVAPRSCGVWPRIPARPNYREYQPDAPARKCGSPFENCPCWRVRREWSRGHAARVPGHGARGARPEVPATSSSLKIDVSLWRHRRRFFQIGGHIGIDLFLVSAPVLCRKQVKTAPTRRRCCVGAVRKWTNRPKTEQSDPVCQRGEFFQIWNVAGSRLSATYVDLDSRSTWIVD